MNWGVTVDQSITVVVPLVPAHDHFLPNLIGQLSSERDVIAKVVLARSSARSRNMRELFGTVRRLEADYGVRINVLATHRQQLAGQNRNRGWHNVQTPFTAFLDADDEYAQDRLSTLMQVAESENSDLVLHDFMLKERETDVLPMATWSTQDLIRTEYLYEATFAEGRDRAREGRTPGDTNVRVPQEGAKVRRVHHGHVLVRTEMRKTYAFSNLYPGEDGQFCRDILWGGGRVVYVPAQLSAYRPHMSAETSAGLTLRIRRRIAKDYRRLRSDLA